MLYRLLVLLWEIRLVFDCGYVEVSSSQVMLRGIQVNRDQFPEVPLVYFCNGYVEVY